MARPRRLILAASMLTVTAVGAWAHAPDLHPLADDSRVARLVVTLEDHRMDAFAPDGKLLKTYRVSVGQRTAEGDKRRAGDDRTPRGVYTLAPASKSVAHMAIRTNYPTPAQEIDAARDGRNPGRDIMVHGLMPWYAWAGRLHTIVDYTHGCVAVTNPEIEELHAAVKRYTRDGHTATIDIRDGPATHG